MSVTITGGAAPLYAEILARAARAGDFDGPCLLPDWRPAEPGEPAEFFEFGGYPRAYDRERATPMVAMHGPERPAEVHTSFTYRAGPARSTVRVLHTRSRLLALAEIVRKHWSLYGGGFKPAEIARAIRPRAWPASLVKVWAGQISDSDFVGALAAGDSLGALFYPRAGGGDILMMVAPMPVDGLPECFASVRRSCDLRYSVTHIPSGRTMRGGFASRRAAEEQAREIWSGRTEEQRETILRSVQPVCQSEMRAAWLAQHPEAA